MRDIVAVNSPRWHCSSNNFALLGGVAHDRKKYHISIALCLSLSQFFLLYHHFTLTHFIIFHLIILKFNFIFHKFLSGFSFY